jgi:hypothetical protein
VRPDAREDLTMVYEDMKRNATSKHLILKRMFEHLSAVEEWNDPIGTKQKKRKERKTKEDKMARKKKNMEKKKKAKGQRRGKERTGERKISLKVPFRWFRSMVTHRSM